MMTISLRILSLCGVFALAAALSLKEYHQKPFTVSRRHVLAACLGSASSLPLYSSIYGSNRANGACIPGDLSPDCIGVYKEKITVQGTDDEIRMSYGAFRPDREPIVLRKPKSFDDALGVLSDQRLAMDDIEQLVTGGKLEDAGILMLRLLPKITLAGRFMVAAVQKSAPQIGAMLEQAEQSASAVDISIGRAIKGRMGSTTVAQLQVLSDVSQAKSALDDLITVAKSGAGIR